MHHHPVDQLEEIGLPRCIRKIVDSLLAEDKDVSPHKACSDIKQLILDDLPTKHELKSSASNDNLWEALKEKVRNYIKFQRKKKWSDYSI